MKKLFLLLFVLSCGGEGERPLTVCGQEAKVVGGTEVDPETRLALKVGRGCSGILIAPHVVLTAAHCGEPTFVTDHEWQAGVWQTIPHPDYNYPNNDIAVLILEEALPGPYPDIASPYEGQALVAGFGLDENEVAGVLRIGEVYIDHIRGNSIIVTASGCPDSCYGDSGGPLYQDGYLVGLVSGGLTGVCGEGGTYTAVDVNANWIAEVTGDFYPAL